MEEQTKIMWDFMEAAFRTGALDEILQLVNVVSGKNFEDMSQGFADLEDIFMEMEDTSSLEENFGTFYQVLKELTNDDVLEGIGILLSFVNPWIESLVQKGGGDSPLSSEKQEELRTKFIKSVKSIFTLGSLGSKMYFASIEKKSPNQFGQEIGKALNSFTAFGNDVIAKDTDVVSDFMAGVFGTVDKKGIGKMADSLTGGILDQRPPLFKWAAATAVKRAKKRLLNK